jgi:hypothetical protein
MLIMHKYINVQSQAALLKGRTTRWSSVLNEKLTTGGVFNEKLTTGGVFNEKLTTGGASASQQIPRLL